MGKQHPIDLEALRSIFADKRNHICIASVKMIHLAADRSHVKCLVSILPGGDEMVATMTWENVGPDSGDFELPSVNDLVLVAFADGDSNQCFVIRRMTSLEDKIPLQAAEGDRAIVAKNGKKIWVSSEERINLSRGSDVPAQALVLGNIFKEAISELIELVANHTHPTSSPGSPTGAPMEQTEIMEIKADPFDNGAVLSDFAFTEK